MGAEAYSVVGIWAFSQPRGQHNSGRMVANAEVIPVAPQRPSHGQNGASSKLAGHFKSQ
jgi:hypothetical protein